jgi:hypothetical protein
MGSDVSTPECHAPCSPVTCEDAGRQAGRAVLFCSQKAAGSRLAISQTQVSGTAGHIRQLTVYGRGAWVSFPPLHDTLASR